MCVCVRGRGGGTVWRSRKGRGRDGETNKQVKKGKGRRVEGREEKGGARKEGTDSMHRRGKDLWGTV